MGGNRAGLVLPLFVLVLILAACGSSAGGAPSGPPDAPVLDVGAVRAVDLGAYDSVGVTETGIYTVRGAEIIGWSPAGEQRWTIRAPGDASAAGRVDPVPFHGVLLTAGASGSVAYSTETGDELWRSPEERWSVGTVRDGLIVVRDPASGADRWTADPARWGCAPPVAADGPEVVPLRDIVLLRCPTRFDGGAGLDHVVAGLDPATGEQRWQRQLTGSGTAVVDTAGTLAVRTDTGHVLLAAATGAELGHRPSGDAAGYRLPRPGGTALVMDSTTLAENTEMRLVEPDGAVRWTAPLAAGEEVLVATAASSNTVLATVRRRSDGHAAASLLAYDAATGARTHVAGPGATASDGEPLLTMPVATTATIRSAPWGVLVAGGGHAAVIPSG